MINLHLLLLAVHLVMYAQSPKVYSLRESTSKSGSKLSIRFTQEVTCLVWNLQNTWGHHLYLVIGVTIEFFSMKYWTQNPCPLITGAETEPFTIWCIFGGSLARTPLFLHFSLNWRLRCLHNAFVFHCDLRL